MDKNKLLRIIAKDLEELNEITQELTDKNQLTGIEIEFALSKSRLILQAYEFLKEMNSQLREQVLPAERPIPAPAPEPINGQQRRDDRPAEPTPPILADRHADKLPKPETIQETQPEAVVAPPARDIPGPAPHETEKAAVATTTPSVKNDAEELQPDEQEEEEVIENHKKIVGEFFSQGKSLNELLSGAHKLDQQLASTPIARLESAIGLNDRFQFIRELFNNDPNLFHATVTQIDRMNDMTEAVSYLSSNFRWKKNEMSIKFAQLVKRRFSN
ncbi:MAG: hypothetical protein AB7U05_03390 [Mangrovibacterium sp.]